VPTYQVGMRYWENGVADNLQMDFGDFVMDAGAVAAVIVGAAEGCLLQAATDGGAVTAEQIVRTLLILAVGGPVSGA
jgi:hypothetical protein